MAYGKEAKAMAKSATVGREGYFRIDRAGDSADVIVNTALGPWYREQQWPDGQDRPDIAPMGSGLYAPHAEVALWALQPGGSWAPRMWDGPLRHIAPLIELAEPGVVLRVTKREAPHPSKRSWRVVSYEVAEVGTLDYAGQSTDAWPTPKGRDENTPAPVPPPVQTRTEYAAPVAPAPVYGAPRTRARNDEMPF